jgi:hypothetical protein
VLSGYCAYPAGWLGDRVEAVVPLPLSSWTNVFVGMVFGLLVMGVQVPATRARVPRVIVLVVCSIVIYTLAVWLAVINYGPLNLGGATSVLLSGALGAVLTTGAVVIIAPLPADPRIWIYAISAGLAGGAVFYYTINASIESAALQAIVIGSGYAAWQVLVCLALHFGTLRAPRHAAHSA